MALAGMPSWHGGGTGGWTERPTYGGAENERKKKGGREEGTNIGTQGEEGGRVEEGGRRRANHADGRKNALEYSGAAPSPPPPLSRREWGREFHLPDPTFWCSSSCLRQKTSIECPGRHFFLYPTYVVVGMSIPTGDGRVISSAREMKG